MPEGLEAEIWRRALEALIGRTITSVWVDERVADPGLAVVLPGTTIQRIDRHGKIVRIHTADHVLGLHFGMTGRVIVDGTAPIESLEYASTQERPEWDRLRIHTCGANPSDPPALRLNDPRRLGRSSLDADLSHLGTDIFAVDPGQLAAALDGRRAAIKTVLLDQSVIAGLGNLCADEVLWWAGIAPGRRVDTLTATERRALSTSIRRRLPIMLRRGGSTTGVLDPELRRAIGLCPRDGAALARSTIGGRTAVWCPQHQR
jgi:formamidopyrimidine-DNA glycosylase